MDNQSKQQQADTVTFENVHDVLHHIQINLKAPKNQHNKFGGYNYRNCEDIFEGLKEVLPPNAHVTVSDKIVVLANRVYIKATACLEYKGKQVCNVAFAREPESKKGMDESQVTGASSSYARKYALNGLFLIDDTRDADADEKPKEEKPVKKTEPKKEEPKVTQNLEFTQADYEFVVERLAKCHDLEGLDAIADYARKNWKRMAKSYQDLITKAINNKKVEIAGIVP